MATQNHVQSEHLVGSGPGAIYKHPLSISAIIYFQYIYNILLRYTYEVRRQQSSSYT